MPNAARLALLVAFTALPTTVVLATNDGWGKWQDDGANIYEFLGNHQFRFSGYKKVWVPHQGARNPISTFYRRDERGQYMREHKELSGAWEAGENVCTVTHTGGNKAAGNLKIYVGSIECCMEARRLGPTLVLRALSGGAPATDKAGEPDICASRTLKQEPK